MCIVVAEEAWWIMFPNMKVWLEQIQLYNFIYRFVPSTDKYKNTRDVLVQGQESKVSNKVYLVTRTKHIVKLGKLW